MFNGFTHRTIDFMWNLRFNNRREWFLEHKEAFQNDLNIPMKALANELLERINEKFPGRDFSVKVSRIYKDARRVKNGEFYRDHLWLTLEKPVEDSTVIPVFWFELNPEGWSYGLGYYRARPLTMAKLRARIDKAPRKFEKLINPLFEQKEFVLEGGEYHRKREAPTEKTALFYNKKSFSFVHEEPNSEELFSPEFADRIIKGFEFLMPYYDYLINVDQDPEPVIS